PLRGASFAVFGERRGEVLGDLFREPLLEDFFDAARLGAMAGVAQSDCERENGVVCDGRRGDSLIRRGEGGLPVSRARLDERELRERGAVLGRELERFRERG